jgi:hypothetical protein
MAQRSARVCLVLEEWMTVISERVPGMVGNLAGAAGLVCRAALGT